AGAALWIKADLVDRGGRGESEPKIEKVKPGELALSGAGMPATRPADAAKAGPPDKITPQVEAKQTQMDINAIEALISAEATKPLNERSYEPIIAKLKPLAEQAGDPVGKTYAETRIRQLQEEIQLAQAVRQIREMKEKAIMDADQIAQERMKIKAEPGAPMDDIAIRGEVQVSGLYDGSAGRPKRWRVVSPGERRTLAYIEVPESSPIDPVLFYGKYVGIRASTRRMTENTTPPLPLLTVQEIVVLDPLARKAAFASENPPAVPVSENESSQPATEMTPAEPAPAASTQPAAAENN
ncbi:MAG TPA: hypothetical protein VLM89_04945, partial [Phycisphaerae bacterium]|nr:hypothetical protein [Phycisphaerae bacterium]